MPLNFNPYQSTYVDPGSVKISETLRTRFSDAFTADDEFSGKVSSMISLTPDEGAKSLLEEKYRAILDERADKGDYENMGMQIVRDARKFKTEYEPIQEQAARRAQIEEELKGRVGSSDNGITNEMYQNAMNFMDNSYAATGGVSEGGAFSGMNVPEYVDILDEVLKDIKDIKPDATGGWEVEYAGIGGAEAAQTGLLGQAGAGAGYDPNIMFSYKTKDGGREYVHPSEIQALFNARISDPKVREYLAFDSRMKVYNMSDEQASGTLSKSVEQLRKSAEASNDPETKQSYQNAAAERENILNTGDITKIRSAAETAVYHSTLDPIRQAAIAKGAYVKELGTSGRYLNVDQAWTNARRAASEDVIAFSGVTGALQEQNAASGVDMNSKTRYLEAQQASIDAMKTGAVAKQLQQDLNITFDQLDEMSAEDYAAAQGLDIKNLDQAGQSTMALFNRNKTNLLETQANIVATEQAINEIRTDLGLTEDVVFGNVMEINTGGEGLTALGFGNVGEIVSKMGESLPNMNEKSRVKLLMSMAASKDPGAFAARKHFDGTQITGNDWIQFSNENPEAAAKLSESFTLNKGQAGEQSIFNSNAFLRGLRELNTYVNDDVVDALNTEAALRSTQQFAPTLYNIIPGMGKQQDAAMEDLLKGTSAFLTGNVFVSPTTGELVALDELAEQSGSREGLLNDVDYDLASMELTDVKYNIASIGRNGGTVQVVYQDKDGNKLPAQIPMTHIHNPEIEAFVNGDSYRIVRQAAAQYSEGIKSPVVHLRNNDTGAITEIQIDLKRKTWYDPQKNVSGTLESALAADGLFATLGEYNSVIVPRGY